MEQDVILEYFRSVRGLNSIQLQSYAHIYYHTPYFYYENSLAYLM